MVKEKFITTFKGIPVYRQIDTHITEEFDFDDFFRLEPLKKVTSLSITKDKYNMKTWGYASVTNKYRLQYKGEFYYTKTIEALLNLINTFSK